jgi:hypothetical protein
MISKVEICPTGTFRCIDCKKVYKRTPKTRNRRRLCDKCLRKLRRNNMKLHSRLNKRQEKEDKNNDTGLKILRIIRRLRQDMKTDKKLRMQIEKICET